MRTLHTFGVAVAIAGLPLAGFVVMASLVELATGRPLRRKLSGPGRQAAVWSMLCLSLGVFIIGLSLATDWSANDPAVALAVAGPAVFILIGLGLVFQGKSRRQQRAGASPDRGVMPGTSHGI